MALLGRLLSFLTRNQERLSDFLMDFLSIAIHEMGHTFGMLDLYTAECSMETMYGYGDNGEIHSRTLAVGDIIGLDILY